MKIILKSQNVGQQPQELDEMQLDEVSETEWSKSIADELGSINYYRYHIDSIKEEYHAFKLALSTYIGGELEFKFVVSDVVCCKQNGESIPLSDCLGYNLDSVKIEAISYPKVGKDIHSKIDFLLSMGAKTINLSIWNAEEVYVVFTDTSQKPRHSSRRNLPMFNHEVRSPSQPPMRGRRGEVWHKPPLHEEGPSPEYAHWHGL